MAVQAAESDPRPTPVPSAPAPEEHPRAPVQEAGPAPVRPASSTLLDPAPQPAPGIVDVGEADRGADPTRGASLPPRSAGGESAAGPPPPASLAEAEDRSIQELFWGEI